jgi:cell division septum initiation protein DivIVA
MSDRLEDLIQEIAAKHGIVVSRDDPILVLQTMNYRLLQESAQAQQVQLDHYKEELEALSLRWGNDAKGKAERILNLALQASKDAIGQATQHAAATTAATVAVEIDSALARLRQAVLDAHRVAMLNVVAACITMAAAGVALWTAMG